MSREVGKKKKWIDGDVVGWVGMVESYRVSPRLGAGGWDVREVAGLLGLKADELEQLVRSYVASRPRNQVLGNRWGATLRGDKFWFLPANMAGGMCAGLINWVLYEDGGTTEEIRLKMQEKKDDGGFELGKLLPNGG